MSHSQDCYSDSLSELSVVIFSLESTPFVYLHHQAAAISPKLAAVAALQELLIKARP